MTDDLYLESFLLAAAAFEWRARTIRSEWEPTPFEMPGREHALQTADQMDCLAFEARTLMTVARRWLPLYRAATQSAFEENVNDSE